MDSMRKYKYKSNGGKGQDLPRGENDFRAPWNNNELEVLKY